VSSEILAVTGDKKQNFLACMGFAALMHRPVKAAGRARRALALSLPIVKRTALAGALGPAI